MPRTPLLRACIIAALAMLLSLSLTACSERKGEDYLPRYADTPPSNKVIYRFGVHPLHNPQRMFEVYEPLVEYLNRRFDGAQIELQASSSYAAFEEKLARRQLHLALPNPYQTIKGAEYGYRVFGKMGDDASFRGIILVRKDSGIASVADLKGKAVSYPAPTALAATLLPQWFLHTHGVRVNDEIDNRYVGSQESSIMNVVLGTTAAGATWPQPWKAFIKDHPDFAAQLEVKWETDTLMNNSLMARDDMPQAVVARIGELMFNLHRDAEGREILQRMQLSRFEPADDATYKPVRSFLSRFEQEVRPVEGKR